MWGAIGHPHTHTHTKTHTHTRTHAHTPTPTHSLSSLSVPFCGHVHGAHVKTLFGQHRTRQVATDAGSGLPDLDTAYEMGSNTKTFTTLSFYREMQRGVVGLVDPLNAHLPSFAINNPYSTGIVTLASLAAQCSGLPRASVCGNLPPCSTHDIVGSLQYQDVKFAPGTEGDYSNLAISLLGEIARACVCDKSKQESASDNEHAKRTGDPSSPIDKPEIQTRSVAG